MNRAVMAFAVLVLDSELSSAAPQELTRCVAGQQVIDKEGRSGVIVADDNKLCQVKYADGQIYDWIFWNLRPRAPAAEPAVVTPDASAPDRTGTPPSTTAPPALTILRPSSSRTLVYRADRRGQGDPAARRDLRRPRLRAAPDRRRAGIRPGPGAGHPVVRGDPLLGCVSLR